MTELKRTPLYEQYKALGVKFVAFGGWELPVQFSSIKEEHEAVRTRAGLFDVSHMGEVEITGEDALSFLQKLLTNDVSRLSDGQVQYTLMCNEYGGTIDDLLVYRKERDHYFLVLNAANTEKDLEWMRKNRFGDVEITDVSSKTALLALQGPLAERIVQKVADTDVKAIRFFRFADRVDVAGIPVLISRTGYTGEDGFELYCASDDVVALWNALLVAGEDEGLIPCGLGARDLLRFEAGLPLYGQELSETITPFEAGLDFVVKLNKKEEFIGKEALLKQKEEGVARKLVGIEMIDRGIPRTGYDVFVADEKVGVITSGTQSLSLKKNVGLALIDRDYTALDTVVNVQVRNKRLKAKVVKTPFYQREKGA